MSLRKPTLHVVYDGPGLAGKTTSMSFVRERIGATATVTAKSESTPLGALRVEFSVERVGVILTVSGIVGSAWAPADWHSERIAADAIVFVIDSQPQRMAANEERLEMINDSFARIARVIPVVLQLNKRDLATADWAESIEGKMTPRSAPLVTVERLSEVLNHWSAPVFPSVASKGEGVCEAFEAAVKLAASGRQLNLERLL